MSGVEHGNREFLISCRRVGGVLDPRSCDRVRKSPLLILLIIHVFCGCVDPIWETYGLQERAHVLCLVNELVSTVTIGG